MIQEATYSTILYLDVLEHVSDDRGQLSAAAALLSSARYLIVLVPAHQFLYSAFDQAIGHYRRYSPTSLAGLEPPHCRLVLMRSLDSVGLLASLANAFLLRQSPPTSGQIHSWDRLLVPLSRYVDPVLGYRVGKSILAIWQRGEDTDETI